MLILALGILSSPAAAFYCLPILAKAAETESINIPLPKSVHELVRDYSGLVFATKRQNRSYRHAFDRRSDGKTLAVSLDFPIVTQLNNYFNDKPKTASVFNLYKRIFFERLKKDPLWDQIREVHGGIKLLYVDYKNIGLIFNAPTPEVREQIKNRLREIQMDVADEFYRATQGIPELVDISKHDKSIVSNRRNWVIYGFGDNPMQATVTSRLGRYHPTKEGVPDIREFSDAEVQEELKQKFHDADVLREGIVRAFTVMERVANRELGVTVGLNRYSERKVLSTRVWDVLRKIKVVVPNKPNGDPPTKTELEDAYVAAVQMEMLTEFRIEVPRAVVLRMQNYYHLIDNFLPRVHERREMSIDVTEAPYGAIYVDVRGQTPRNLFRMAQELATFAEEGDLAMPDMTDRVAHAVRVGQDAASRKFQKVRKAIKRFVTLTGIKARVHISGDEIAILLDEPLSTGTFRTYVATMAHDALPVRPVLVAGGTRDFNGNHVSKGEAIEKALRQKLKEGKKFPVEDWEKLTIAVQILPNGPDGGSVRLWVAEEASSGPSIVERAMPLLQKWLDDGTIADVAPAGYRVSEVSRASAIRP